MSRDRNELFARLVREGPQPNPQELAIMDQLETGIDEFAQAYGVPLTGQALDGAIAGLAALLHTSQTRAISGDDISGVFLSILMRRHVNETSP